MWLQSYKINIILKRLFGLFEWEVSGIIVVAFFLLTMWLQSRKINIILKRLLVEWGVYKWYLLLLLSYDVFAVMQNKYYPEKDCWIFLGGVTNF